MSFCVLRYNYGSARHIRLAGKTSWGACALLCTQYGKNMHTLAELNWLNDKIINVYMNMIMDRDYQQAEHKDKKESNLDLSDWTSQYPENIQQQMNASDCGVFGCKFPEYASWDTSIIFDQIHMAFRRSMVWEILNKKLL
ncbi:sentrin-specific protease 2-like isoform X1 [Branchiostoma lanceolatum]|uniref:sentrin-specific protease 2-like isoform X1 n=1 Tax=Branchiostoma lanceolatum TaxID=7740 RepID=UPI003455B77C